MKKNSWLQRHMAFKSRQKLCPMNLMCENQNSLSITDTKFYFCTIFLISYGTKVYLICTKNNNRYKNNSTNSHKVSLIE